MGFDLNVVSQGTLIRSLRIIIIAATAFMLHSELALAQLDCAFAVKAGGTGWDSTLGAAEDRTNGGIVVCGYFEGVATFGTKTLTSAGESDIFIAKYDTSQNCVWAKRAGGPSADVAHAVAVDSTGNIFVTGGIGESAEFDSKTIAGYGGQDIFLAKYDSSGTCLWVKHFGGFLCELGYAISLTPEGDCLISGSFASPEVDFGNSFMLDGKGFWDIFLAKYASADGRCVWARRAGGESDVCGADSGTGLAVDASGAIFLSGYFSETSDFSDTINLTSAGEDDAFLAKYDSSGNCLWAVRAGGPTKDSASCVAIDTNGNSYIVGAINGTADFGGGISLTGGVEYQLYLAKFTPAGSCAWAKAISDKRGYISGYIPLCVDASGDCHVMGTGDFSSFALNTYDTAGNLSWTYELNYCKPYANTIRRLDSGDYFIAGVFLGNLFLDADHNLSSSGGYDIFLAGFTPTPSYSVTFNAGEGGTLSCGSETGKSSVVQKVFKGKNCDNVTAVPSEGYVFSGWSGDVPAADSGNPISVTDVREDMTIAANFAAKPQGQFNVMFLAESEGYLVGTAVQTVESGSSCEAVAAYAYNGYKFAGWIGDHVGIENPLTITDVTKDMTVTATFVNASSAVIGRLSLKSRHQESLKKDKATGVYAVLSKDSYALRFSIMLPQEFDLSEINASTPLSFIFFDEDYGFSATLGEADPSKSKFDAPANGGYATFITTVQDQSTGRTLVTETIKLKWDKNKKLQISVSGKPLQNAGRNIMDLSMLQDSKFTDKEEVCPVIFGDATARAYFSCAGKKVTKLGKDQKTNLVSWSVSGK